MTTPTPPPDAPRPTGRRLRNVIGPRLRPVLGVVFGLFALLTVNAVYLLGVRVVENATGQTYQNWLYIIMFLFHLVLGLVFIVPVLIFGIGHMLRARKRPNRRAVRVGYALFAVSLVLLISGVVLTRIEGVLEVKDPAVRSVAWWLHVLTPLAAAWLFVIHRLAGKRIRWKTGARWAVVAAAFAGVMLILQVQDPRRWNVEGPESGEQYFFPSLSRTATGDFIPARVLQNDAYCQECHADVHERWANSAHKFSSFNNPAYLFSVRQTREFGMERDGTVQASRFCAGCHDPVPFFAGRFDDPEFDDERDPTAHAGITCTSCHAITHINSVKGNADYTIEEPLHYPFAFSDNQALGWVNRQLVKSKPGLHKKTFLKPLHQSPEFCGSCHKVHLPEELNGYKWLRGQNHYDTYFLSGVSGQGVGSFYYPEKAVPNCNQCHMEVRDSDDFGARDFDGDGALEVHDHLFPSANTALAKLMDLPDWVIEEHARFNEGATRVDLFGFRRGGSIDSRLTAPVGNPEDGPTPVLTPGQIYLMEAVIRTLKLGHPLTQGTADSNELWLEATVESGGRVLGKSGGLGDDRAGRAVDPWAHFVNAYVLDREGKRIDRRNAQDIFIPLYSNQIPPGAASVVHYRLDLPGGVTEPVTVTLRLRYRKFDTTYMRYVFGDDYVNELPILTLATDSVTFPVEGGEPVEPRVADATADPNVPPSPVSEPPLWQRWNDYGIGLLRSGELAGAEAAFKEVEALGRPDGPLNLARVYIEQGTIQNEAVAALSRAAEFDPPAPPWLVAFFSGQVNKQNGFLDEAIEDFESIVELDTEETRERGFDFSKDYRLLVELGQTLVERSKLERGEARKERRQEYLQRAAGYFEQALVLDPENANAHYNLSLAYRQLGRPGEGTEHFRAYQKYRVDDNARDRAIAVARSDNPAADHAADRVVIYDLQRPGAYGMSGSDAGSGPATPAARPDPSVRIGG
jgi:tetratricopeptide (TPR) repeat protein